MIWNVFLPFLLREYDDMENLDELCECFPSETLTRDDNRSFKILKLTS